MAISETTTGYNGPLSALAFITAEAFIKAAQVFIKAAQAVLKAAQAVLKAAQAVLKAAQAVLKNSLTHRRKTPRRGSKRHERRGDYQDLILPQIKGSAR